MNQLEVVTLVAVAEDLDSFLNDISGLAVPTHKREYVAEDLDSFLNDILVTVHIHQAFPSEMRRTSLPKARGPTHSFAIRGT